MRLGHQPQRPKITAIAGTRAVLTTNVSMRTPTATANPICISPRMLALIMAAKVPAMIIPAEVIIPPVIATACLLYTSDAADDLLCVDLGGRRIIKKKKKKKYLNN